MTQARASLDWLLKDLPGDVPGTRHVVVLSADGLRIAQHTTDDDAADRISAACSGCRAWRPPSPPSSPAATAPRG